MSTFKTYCFWGSLHTIFLHFQDIESIDWLQETSTNECKLMVSPIVIDELDEKKIGTSRLSNKARKVLNRLEELAELENAEIRKNVFLEVIINKPQRIVYEENGLNFNEQDHRLIASIIEFRDKSNLNDIVLCTNDIGPRLRAKQFNIEALKLNDKYLIPSQDSEEEKKIKKLEQEIRTLKNKIPLLSLMFSNDKEFIQFELNKFKEIDFKELKVKMMDEIKMKYPYIEQIDPYKNPASLIAQNMFSLTSDQINTYNKKLDDFFLKYEKAIDGFYEHEIKQKLTFELEFVLSNSGNCPAENIDIHLHFPDGFEVVESDDIENEIELPEPPYKPKNRLDFGQSTFSSLSSVYPTLNVANNLKFNRPTIKKTNSFDVDFYRKNLKHGYDEKLESLSIIFENHAEIKNFQVGYEISASNIPEKIKGNLNVIFRK